MDVDFADDGAACVDGGEYGSFEGAVFASGVYYGVLEELALCEHALDLCIGNKIVDVAGDFTGAGGAGGDGYGEDPRGIALAEDVYDGTFADAGGADDEVELAG